MAAVCSESGDSALESRAHFLAVAEHRHIPARFWARACPDSVFGGQVCRCCFFAAFFLSSRFALCEWQGVEIDSEINLLSLIDNSKRFLGEVGAGFILTCLGTVVC